MKKYQNCKIGSLIPKKIGNKNQNNYRATILLKGVMLVLIFAHFRISGYLTTSLWSIFHFLNHKMWAETIKFIILCYRKFSYHRSFNYMSGYMWYYPPQDHINSINSWKSQKLGIILAEIAKQIPLIESNEEDSLKLELRCIKDNKEVLGDNFLVYSTGLWKVLS